MSKNHKPDNLPDKIEQLRIENELKKLKLSLEYGADFSGINENLSPETESQFLEYVMNFEDAFDLVGFIPVFDKLGKPDYRKTEEIPDTEIGTELDNLLRLLNEYNISVDTICEVENRELYRFITEELFLEKINDMTVAGMVTHFTYEEFHPNHAHDIESHSTDFFRIYLDHKSEYYLNFLSAEATKANWHRDFRTSFSSFTINSFSIFDITFDTEKAQVLFECDFTGKIENSNETVRYQGKGEMNLVYQWDFWCIDTLKLPEIE